MTENLKNRKQMTEKELQNKVAKFLKSQPRTWFFKVWGGGYQKAGIPDIICCVNGLFIALELKSDAGKPTALQRINISRINAAGGLGIVLYPSGFETFKKLVEEVNLCSIPTAKLNVLRNVPISSILDTSKG